MPSITNPRKNNPTRTFRKNIITARRGTIPQSGATITIPIGVNKIKIRNTHSTISFGINFNNDSITNYWKVSPQEVLELEVSELTIIKVKGIGGDSSFEAIIS